MVGRNRKLKYSRNRFLGPAEPSEPIPKPVPRIIGKARLVNTEYRSLGTSGVLVEYQAHWRFRDSVWYSSARGTSSGIVFSGESVEHGYSEHQSYESPAHCLIVTREGCSVPGFISRLPAAMILEYN
ncbi:hypothetical protein E2C01_092611 [Portunus trituberculatus]|uniref:Uncharacterized protein n=1 Tax=Portunus trituberculatus TaxID=210409 RepID=A0A5B7JMG7_PORTR|nr:hypothetical protein [Portunus trituberculatus]